MKVVFDREEILQRLKKASSFVPKKALISAYETFLFDIKGNRADITATDGNKQITIKCDVIKSDKVGKFTVPARLIVHVLGLLLEKDVTITTKEGKVEVKSGKSKYNMPSEDGSTYPLMNPVKADYEASLTGISFNRAMEITKSFADPENASVVLQGVVLRSGVNNTIDAFGCNGGHAAKVVISPRSINKWDDIVIPTQSLTAINKCVSDDAIVDIIHNKERFEINTDEVSIKSVCIDAKYPNVGMFFNDDAKDKVELNTVQFLHALQRIDVFSPKEVPLIRIGISTTQLTIETSDDAFNHDGEEVIDIIAEKELSIAVNIKMVTNVIESFTNDTFNMYYDALNKPLKIEPINMAKDNDMFFVVMPYKS